MIQSAYDAYPSSQWLSNLICLIGYNASSLEEAYQINMFILHIYR